jgi:diguanylate cyclase (GGDEF)-like protein
MGIQTMFRVRTILSIFLPGGLAAAASMVLLRPGLLPEAAAPYLSAYPYAVFAIGAFLAWLFNRSRALFALGILVLADRGLALVATASSVGAEGRATFDLLSVLLPLNLAVYGRLRERGLITIAGLTRVLLILLQLIVAGELVLLWPEQVRRWLEYLLVHPALTDWTAVPPVGLLAFASAIVILALRRRPGPIDAGLLWAVAFAFVALHAAGAGWPPVAGLAAGGLALVVALLQVAYRMAYHDDLTDLPGRRALAEALQQVESPYAVAMVDVDHFKAFNDTYGHDVGDQVLRMVAARLGGVSGAGRAFRYGGEEFCIVFLGKTAAEAAPHLEAVREAVAATRFIVRAPGRPRKKPAKPARPSGPQKEEAVTVSIGLADDAAGGDPQEVIKAADQALYRAKNGGRNQLAT